VVKQSAIINPNAKQKKELRVIKDKIMKNINKFQYIFIFFNGFYAAV